MNDEELRKLEDRLGPLHARQRLGIEVDHEAQVFGQGLNFFHPENWYASPSLIRAVLKLTGLYGRAYRNAAEVQVRHNDLASRRLPPRFDGFTLLHISDPHADMNEGAMRRAAELLPGLHYDLCVLTGDFRGPSYGPYDAALSAMAELRANHDTIRMVPRLEAMGIRMLLNECETISRDGQQIYLAGIDDAHFFRADNFDKAAGGIPSDAFAILLSHTPEIYRQAAHAGFASVLCGHTHGGQICLPGGTPITLDSVLPRRLGAGAWTYNNMAGYTSVGLGSSIVTARLNCPPEITLHHLRCE
jgi:predicted MPP superfamily phosphohydrolase